jgi:ATP-dependent exoDNAse (exonuclease V) beta subunit
MKMSQFKQLIREEIRRALQEAVDPIEKVYSRLYSIADRAGSDRFLNALDEYLISVGVYDIFEKWLEREDTGVSLTTSESNKLLRALTEFLEGSKSPATNFKRIFKLVTKINRANPGLVIPWDNSKESLDRLYTFINKQLTPGSVKILQMAAAGDRDEVYGSKSQIDTLVRELEQISAKQGRM